MSGWHRRNPDKDPSEEPFYWMRSMKTPKTPPKKRGTFTAKCPHCSEQGKYCWRTDHDKNKESV